MSFFTILFFLLCLRFTTYTYKHEHAFKSPHFPPNPCNLFFDISHFESFHLFPSSTLSVSPHLLLFMNSSIRLRPRSSYPPSLFPSVNHGTLILILLAGDVELNPDPSPLNFTHLNPYYNLRYHPSAPFIRSGFLVSYRIRSAMKFSQNVLHYK